MYAWRGALLVCSGIVLNGAIAGALMRPVREKVIENVTESKHVDVVQPSETGDDSVGGNGFEDFIEGTTNDNRTCNENDICNGISNSLQTSVCSESLKTNLKEGQQLYNTS